MINSNNLMKRRSRRNFVVSLAIVAMALTSCQGTTKTETTPEMKGIQQCRPGIPRPVTGEVAFSALRSAGFMVTSDPNADICSSPDALIVLDNLNQGAEAEIRKTQGHLRCSVSRSSYPGREVTQWSYGAWFGYRYKNLSCGLARDGAGRSNKQREKLRKVFETLST